MASLQSFLSVGSLWSHASQKVSGTSLLVSVPPTSAIRQCAMSLGDCRCPSAMTCCFSLKNKDSNSSSSSVFCPIAALDVLLRVREQIGADADHVVGLTG